MRNVAEVVADMLNEQGIPHVHDEEGQLFAFRTRLGDGLETYECRAHYGERPRYVRLVVVLLEKKEAGTAFGLLLKLAGLNSRSRLGTYYRDIRTRDICVAVTLPLRGLGTPDNALWHLLRQLLGAARKARARLVEDLRGPDEPRAPAVRLGRGLIE